MLFFWRKKKASFVIEAGDDVIEVKFMRSINNGDAIKIGVNAPKHVQVNRKEVYDLKKEREKLKNDSHD